MNTDSLDILLAAIAHRLAPATSVLLLGIDGAGGSGKSTFAAVLGQTLVAGEISNDVVHMDDFYRPSAQRQTMDAAEAVIGIGADFDWQRLRDQVLLPLKQGRTAHYQRYDWGADALAEWHTVDHAKRVVIVEGNYTLRHELRPLYDLALWVDCPRDVRLARGLARDGTDARIVWEQYWMPAEDRYIAAHQPQQTADFVVTNADPLAAVIDWRLQQSV